jgi:hypothetical protein
MQHPSKDQIAAVITNYQLQTTNYKGPYFTSLMVQKSEARLGSVKYA